MSLELTAAESTIDAPNPKKSYGSGMPTLIISKGEKGNITKIVKSLEELKLKQKNKKVAFLAFNYIRCYFIGKYGSR